MNTIFQQNVIPKRGIQFIQTNKTGYDESRVRYLVCPICYSTFSRPPSHVARVNISYCSKPCAGVGARVSVITPCVSCGKDMDLIPSSVGKITTCSKKCSTLRRMKDTDNPTSKSSFAAYKKVAKQIAKRGVCENCGVRFGPWVIRGLELKVGTDGTVTVNKKASELWCQHCHLVDVAPMGAPARTWRRAMTNSQGD